VRVNSLINQSFDAEEEEEQREIKQSFAKWMDTIFSLY
jgi:hypothetical protein